MHVHLAFKEYPHIIILPSDNNHFGRNSFVFISTDPIPPDAVLKVVPPPGITYFYAKRECHFLKYTLIPLNEPNLPEYMIESAIFIIFSEPCNINGYPIYPRGLRKYHNFKTSEKSSVYSTLTCDCVTMNKDI